MRSQCLGAIFWVFDGDVGGLLSFCVADSEVGW
jgi:hypothetical protein